jgi:hypothetical protein
MRHLRLPCLESGVDDGDGPIPGAGLVKQLLLLILTPWALMGLATRLTHELSTSGRLFR